MYDFVTHTWNIVKGSCLHDCSYCYMKRWGKLKPARLDNSEFKTDLGSDNFIFVGSSNDLFAAEHPAEWIKETLDYCDKFDNKYLFQSKNPDRIWEFIDHPVLLNKSVICTTVETNRFYPEIMNNSPKTGERADAMYDISRYVETHVTIEPIMDFDLSELVALIKSCNSKQVNIGADSGRNHLPEPSKEKVLKLIDELSKFTKVKQKTNLSRLLK